MPTEKRIAKVALLVLADQHVFDKDAWNLWCEQYLKAVVPCDSHWGAVGPLRDTFKLAAVECLLEVICAMGPESHNS